MRQVLIVGKNFSGTSNYLKEHGYEYTVLRDARNAKNPEKKLKRRVLCDFSSEEKILEALANLKVRPDAVVTIYEAYIRPAAFVAKYFGLPGLTQEAADACTDKELMRAKFAKTPEKISPDFMEVRSLNDAENFAKTHGFPLIIKPANLSKSLLVTKSCTMDELRENYKRSVDAIEKVYAKYAPDAMPKLLIEEFLDGPVYSVDAFVDADGTPHVMEQIVDYQTGYDAGYDDNFHYSRILPSKLSADKQAKLRHCAELGCRALGMTSSPAHIEIIMTADGPRIVEIGARNGGYRERMYRMANGIDITGNALRLALGEPIDIRATKNEPVAVIELFPFSKGSYLGLENESELHALSSLEYLSIKAQPDEIVGKSSDGFKATAIVILHNADAEQFENDLNFVKNNVHVLTKA